MPLVLGSEATPRSRTRRARARHHGQRDLAPPDIPKAGLDRRAYRARKFGSWEQSQALDAQVTAAAQPDGLVFRHELMERTPNTINAHRLIWLAGREGKQNAAVEALFAAYFHDGRDVGDTDVLIDIGTSVGLNGAQVSDMLASDEGLADVRGEPSNSRPSTIQPVCRWVGGIAALLLLLMHVVVMSAQALGILVFEKE